METKKQLDSLRVRKTDKIDAEKLAQSQFVLNRKPTYVQEEVYQDLRDLSRFYQNLTEDTVRTKNRFVNDRYGNPGLNYLCAGYRRFFEHIAPTMDEMKKAFTVE